MKKPTRRIKVDGEKGSFIVDKLEWDNFSQNYKAIFERMMMDLEGDDRIASIIFGYDEMLDGYTIQIFTKRCTLFRINDVFLPDHSNDKALTEKFLAEWLKLPLEESDKEQYEGIWKVTGKKIRFNRMWNNYRFSDEQCEDLLEGKHIQFDSISKSGEEKSYCGILDEQEYKGFRYFGFKLDGWALPKVFQKHELTENERTLLLAGKEVYLENLFSNKKQKFYNAYVQYNMKDGLRITRFGNAPQTKRNSWEREFDNYPSYGDMISFDEY